MNNKIRVGTVFSGIGAFEFALKRLNIEHEIVLACDNGNRIIEYNREDELNKIKSLANYEAKKNYVDNLYRAKTKKRNFVKESFIANYPIDELSYYQDIALLDGTDFYRKIDILVGGSPCQSFSTIGFKRGLEDARGTLFYEYARLINESKPKVFIYENVRGLKTHDKGNTWEIIKNIFDNLGYDIYDGLLNSKEYGIPQRRARMFVIGFRKQVDFKMPPPSVNCEHSLKDFLLDNCEYGGFNFDKDGKIIINKKPGLIGDRYFLSEKIRNYVMSSGTKTFYQKPEIDLSVARTILSTMGNCHRAGIDNYVTTNNKIRMLTEREALRLMGFTDDFKIVVSTAQMYKQSGNSIVVDILMALMKEIIKTGIFSE